MSQVDHLVEMHIRESEAHLRHIDEMLAKAQAASASRRLAEQHAAPIHRISRQRSQLQSELQALRNARPGGPADLVERSKGIKGLLQAAGLELEKMLTTIGDNRGH